MSPLRALWSIAFAALCIGCAESAAFPTTGERAEAAPPICTDVQDCAAKWRVARVWVVRDAGFPVREATDDLIDTYSGYPAQDPRLFVHVVKVPVGVGRYEIRIAASCHYDFGCIPNRINAMRAFNEAVAAARP